MGARAEAGRLLAASCTAELMFRMAQVALPFVVLAETGSVAATGLVGGAAGIPIVSSPWWARRARQWVRSGRRVAVVMMLEAVAAALVPAAAEIDRLGVVVLATSGLLLGTGQALAAPGMSALLADVGDRLGQDRAVTLLLVQDGLGRICMIVAPPLGAIAVGADLVRQLLWLQAAVILLAGMLAWPVRASVPDRSAKPVGRQAAAPSIRSAVSARPEVLRGWLLRAVGSFTFPVFVLGLSVTGVQQGRSGIDVAIGMTGFGVGAVLGTAAATQLVKRLPTLLMAYCTWAATGVCWLVLGFWLAPVSVAVIAPVAGVLVVLGISAISAIITRSASGAERRALLSGQTVIINAGSSAGMLLGGSLIAAVGPSSALVLAGLLLTAVVVAVASHNRRRRPGQRGLPRLRGRRTASVTRTRAEPVRTQPM